MPPCLYLGVRAPPGSESRLPPRSRAHFPFRTATHSSILPPLPLLHHLGASWWVCRAKCVQHFLTVFTCSHKCDRNISSVYKESLGRDLLIRPSIVLCSTNHVSLHKIVFDVSYFIADLKFVTSGTSGTCVKYFWALLLRHLFMPC